MRSGRIAGWLATLAVAGLLASCGMAGRMNTRKQQDKTAIVLAAFGTSVGEARLVYDYIDQVARRRYPGREIRWAFTSRMIRRKLDKQGVATKHLHEVLADLAQDGFKKVAVQPLLIIPGEEFEKLKQEDTNGVQVRFGQPLLASAEDIERAAHAIRVLAKPGRPNVVVAHGNGKVVTFNEPLVAIAARLKQLDETMLVASVEGQPGSEPLRRARAMAAASGMVHFIPLMIVAGDHVRNDVLGDEAESWKNIVGAQQVSCAEPLGNSQAVLEIYFAHLDRALSDLQSASQGAVK